MSDCLAKTFQEQKKCQFYEKASYSKRCMYRVFDSFCSCINAQVDAKKSIEEKNQEVMDEMKDSEVGKSF